MTTTIEDNEDGLPESHITFFLFHMGLKCIHCRATVLNPEKKKNQLFLKGVCPSCGKDSADFKRPKPPKPKKLSKRERRALKYQKDAEARGKY